MTSAASSSLLGTEIAPRPPAVDRLDIFARKLLSHSKLSRVEHQAILSLPFTLRQLEPGEYIMREGDHAKICPLLLSGFAYRHKLVADGGRQIVALKIPGDPLDFQSLYLRRADHNLQALTAVELAVVPLAALEKLALERPPFARAILVDILVEASIGREWLLNIGRRNALSRLAHFLCELVHRLNQTSSIAGDEVEVPLTQEQLADLLGLTPVHINRTLKTLEEAGAVQRKGRRLKLGNFDTLCRIAEFSDLYLHRNDEDRDGHRSR